MKAKNADFLAAAGQSRGRLVATDFGEVYLKAPPISRILDFVEMSADLSVGADAKAATKAMLSMLAESMECTEDEAFDALIATGPVDGPLAVAFREMCEFAKPGASKVERDTAHIEAEAMAEREVPFGE